MHGLLALSNTCCPTTAVAQSPCSASSIQQLLLQFRHSPTSSSSLVKHPCHQVLEPRQHGLHCCHATPNNNGTNGSSNRSASSRSSSGSMESISARLARVRNSLMGTSSSPASNPNNQTLSNSGTWTGNFPRDPWLDDPLPSKRTDRKPTNSAESTSTPPSNSWEPTDWGSADANDWDPGEEMTPQEQEEVAEQRIQYVRQQAETGGPRDKWVVPILDWQAVKDVLDPDRERAEDNISGEALANKDESQTAVRYVAKLVGVSLVTGFAISRLLADPILNFVLQNNPDAFAMTKHQKVEGAEKVHVEEFRLRMEIAYGRLPPMSEEKLAEHLVEFAEEILEEERQHNESNLITAVSDSVSALVFVVMLAQRTRGRRALYNTIGRLFSGLSDIAKAVLIILVADTSLGYHSVEFWSALIELFLGHYGMEPEEGPKIVFIGTVPVIIDVFIKYWIFTGLNKISPSAVVTIKQLDRH